MVIKFGHAQPEAAGGAKSDISATYGTSGSDYNFLAVLGYRTKQIHCYERT